MENKNMNTTNGSVLANEKGENRKGLWDTCPGLRAKVERHLRPT